MDDAIKRKPWLTSGDLASWRITYTMPNGKVKSDVVLSRGVNKRIKQLESVRLSVIGVERTWKHY